MLTNVLKEDIYSILSNNSLKWDYLRNSTILITGATGLIGSYLCNVLHTANQIYDLNLKFIISGRNKNMLLNLSKNISPYSVISTDIRSSEFVNSINCDVDYIFHCASITSSIIMKKYPADVISTSVNGTMNVLDIAARRNCKCFLYISSMEVYGQSTLKRLTENDLGYIDLTDTRACYPESKRLCENLCISYSHQFGITTKIARLSQTFGAGTPMDDTRVFAQFARSAINKENIVLHTKGTTMGNYCYISDAVSGIFFILLYGSNQGIYNISNSDISCTIYDMAYLVANDICNGIISVIIDIPDNISEYGYAKETHHIIDNSKLTALGWKPSYDLKETYERMLSHWSEIK